MEGSLQSYLLCLTQDNTTLRHYYTSKALLRDPSCTEQLLTLLAGLENISFNMNPYGADLQEASGFSGLTSMTSSLSSPVDSGVALLDSDAEVTSTNETTVTEGDTASLKEEVAMLPELEDNRINDHIVSQEDKNKDVAVISNYIRCDRKKVATGVLESVEERNMNEELGSILKSRFMEKPSDDSHSVKNSVLEKYILPDESSSGICSSAEEQKETTCDTQKSVISNNSLSSNTNNSLSKSNNTSQAMKSCDSEQSDINRMTESFLTLIESTNDSINVGLCKSDESVNDNKWSNDNDVMSKSLGAETTVIKRQRKKKRNGPDVKVKRVSFHEDLLTQSVDSTSGFSASFLPPNPVIKCDVVKGRYSWCAEGDAPYFEQRKNENDTRSDVFLSSSVGKKNTSSIELSTEDSQKSEFTLTESLSVLDCESTNLENMKHACSKSSIIDPKLPPVTERGTPEGQEDPPKTSSLLHLNSITDSVLKKFPSIASSIDWSSDTESDVCDHRLSQKSGLATRRDDRRVSSKCQSALLKFSSFMSPSKASLLKKFMKSVTEKKSNRKKVKLQKTKPLYIKGAKPDPIVVGQSVAELESVYSTVNSITKSGCNVGTAFEKSLKENVFIDSKEMQYKVFKVNSCYFIDGKSEPLLIVLSENGIYFVGLQPSMSLYVNLFIHYSELGSIVVGPSRQTLLFVSLNRNKQMLVTSSNRIITGEVVSHIEVAMRRSSMKLTLPAVGQLELEDMKTLKLQLSKDCVLQNVERLHHYSIAHLQDNPTSPPSTPLGPKKEGHLMFRPATNVPLQSWEPGYFILKGGVVYMFSDQGTRLPKRVIPLHGGQCQGCRRLTQESRPHTFEILLGHKRSFQFAAADEYETSEWLQALVQSASGFYEMEQMNTTACSLIITSRHIIACQEKFPSGCVTVLTCAAITDLVAFSIVSLEDNWCVLEFACHEVHESSGDWAVYFTDSCGMLAFKQDLEILWKGLTQEMFPLHNITNVPLRQRCEETSHYHSAAWDALLLADH